MPPRLQATRLALSLLSIAPRPAACTAPAPRRSPLCGPLSQQRCASILAALSDNQGAYNKKIRRGRGPASGKGKTGGRGQKGQHAHGKVPAGFEGGQTPQSITNPARGRGKHNHFQVEMSPVNLDRIQSWIDQGRLDPAKPITMKELHKSRCIHGVKRHGVKLLARNPEQLTTPIHLVVSRASTEAIARIEALGGTVTTRFYSPTSIKRVLRGDSHPTISLQASADLIQLASASNPALVASPILSALTSATAPDARKEAMAGLMKQLGEQFKYRLPDATGRKDIEYYRDPAHRGYLAYTVKDGESPSLFFKPPGEAKDRKKQSARRDAAKASADNKLF
jgi:large subunit ribosomal protein L15